MTDFKTGTVQANGINFHYLEDADSIERYFSSAKHSRLLNQHQCLGQRRVSLHGRKTSGMPVCGPKRGWRTNPRPE